MDFLLHEKNNIREALGHAQLHQPINVSQGKTRAQRCQLVDMKAETPCLTRKSEIFLTHRRRFLRGLESMAMQCCLSSDELLTLFLDEVLTDSDFNSLAGNAFSAPAAACIKLTLFTCLADIAMPD